MSFTANDPGFAGMCDKEVMNMPLCETGAWLDMTAISAIEVHLEASTAANEDKPPAVVITEEVARSAQVVRQATRQLGEHCLSCQECSETI